VGCVALEGTIVFSAQRCNSRYGEKLPFLKKACRDGYFGSTLMAEAQAAIPRIVLDGNLPTCLFRYYELNFAIAFLPPNDMRARQCAGSGGINVFNLRK
jgi:hypothetical protein